ncbi:MAG: DNA-directed RNA polymerase subunit B, partial [Candidatus Nanohaloarchaea archaeon]
HGASLLLKERFGADSTEIKVCENCGEIAVEDRKENESYCPNCESGELGETEIPHAFLLLLNELKSMMMDTELELEDEE